MYINGTYLDDVEVLTHARRYAAAQLRVQRGWHDANDIAVIQNADAYISANFGPAGIAAMRPIVTAAADALLAQERAETEQANTQLDYLKSAYQTAAEAKAAALRNAGAAKLAAVTGVQRDRPMSEEQLLSLIGTGSYEIPPGKRHVDALAEKFSKQLGKRVAPEAVRQALEAQGRLLDEPSKLTAAAESRFPGDVVAQNRWRESVATNFAKFRLAERREAEVAKNDPGYFTKPVKVEATESEKLRAAIGDALVSENPRNVLDEVQDAGRRDETTGRALDTRAAVADAVAAHWEEPSLADAEAADAKMQTLEEVAVERGLV